MKCSQRYGKALKSISTLIASVALVSCSGEGDDSVEEVLEAEVALERDLALDLEYVQVPGFRVHRSCVHEVPDGAEIEKHSDASVSVRVNGRPTASHQRCAHPFVRTSAQHREERGEERTMSDLLPPAVNGWLMSLDAFAPSNSGRNWFSRMAGRWRVPHDPPTNGALIYIFNSLQSSGTDFEIVQPVLQYGNNGYFGSNAWRIASWWVDSDGNALYSTPKTVSFYTEIRGSITRSSGTCDSAGLCSWAITTSTDTTSTTLNVAKATIHGRMNRANAVALEVYDVDACTDLPDINEWIVGYGTYSNFLYQPPATGDLNLLTNEMYKTASWSKNIRAVSPSCLYSMNSSPADRLVAMGWKWW
jgi:hypothetical protein